ncbi:helix-turn-helix domain-containing protein [Xanthobacter autotrophicus]|uniref:helix-turn-helix domain-containing protein n=1 Tax=Xanthobacter autotrophicus TaxID=280 RepID=UPI003729D794
MAAIRTPKFAPATAGLLCDTEAAAHMGICRAGIWRRLKEGAFPCVRIGGRTLFRRADLDAYIQRQVVGCEVAR